MKKRFLAILSAILAVTVFNVSFAEKDILNGYFGNNTQYSEEIFSDISEPLWAAEAITQLAKYGIVSGSDGLFRPYDTVTRAQLIKIIILSFGLYDPDAKCDFLDVPEGSWHYPYVASARKLGITSGLSNDYFGADEPVTRQQLAALAYNAAKYAGASLEGKKQITFLDAGKIDEYAKEAVAVLSACEAITGNENHMFDPTGIATRAQACKIIYSISVKTLDIF